MNTEVATVKQNVPAVSNETAAVLSMIEKVSLNPDMDVEKLERILDMQERILNKQAEMVFFKAMNEVQSETRRIATDAQNPQTRSRYATYAALDRALRPIYSKHGMCLSFDTGKSEQPDCINVICYVSHVSGYTKRYSVDMPADGKGAKGGDVMTKTHATGAAMSYGMRYLLKMIFNVAIGEDDADGNMPDPNEPDISDWIAKLDECATLDDLQSAFTEAYKTVTHKAARQKLVRAKDIKKKDLQNDQN